LIPYQGEIAALGAACLWAGATVLFRRAGRAIRPLQLNLLKGVIALIFFLGTVLIGRIGFGEISAWAVLVMSGAGIINIGIGDTLYFKGLQIIGSRRTLLLQMLSPAMAALLSLAFLQETLTWKGWVGILITVSGVAWVITERTARERGSRHMLKGIVFAVLAAVASASGAVLAHAVLIRCHINLWWSVIIRLGAGVIFIVLWMVLRKPQEKQWRLPQGAGIWRLVLIASFFGTFVALFLNQAALRFAPAGIAQTLLSTSPLFVLPIAALAGEKLTIRAIAGACVAMLGIVLLFGL